MQIAGNGIELEPGDQNDACHAIVSDLIGLIEHVQASLRLIERTIEREPSPGSQENSANVVVLDDVSPRFMKAAAALKACDANLGIALGSLLDSGASERGTGAYAASPPAFSIVWA